MSTDSADYLRLKDAFLELIDLDADARSARLARLDAEDAAFAVALRRQLAAAGQPLPLLDRALERAAAPTLPNYRVLRELGRGGMGVVWLAERRLGDARQTVALKQIAHAHWNADDLRRFERERRILASLDHPNIAALVDGGTDAGGAAFLATQFIEGERLDRWCATRRPGLRARIVLLRQVVGAVAHAHGKLVVHRDLKPANILVSAEGTAKLLDFGIARALQEDAVTTEGPSQMTLRYAAPEQVGSDGAEGGVSVDIYALGVLMYELLAQRSPYGEASGVAALMHAILEQAPVAPSQVVGAVHGVDADLDAICLKALRKRASDRYPHADALLAELDRWLAGEAVEARRGERGYRWRRFLRRRWPWLAAAVLVLGAVGYHLQALQRQLDDAERQRDKAQALADHFGQLFAEAPPADTERGDVSARELLERSIATLAADGARPPATRAALLLASADALEYLGQLPPALVATREAKRLALAVEPADPDLLASAHSELAGLLDKTGDGAGARREAAAGLALFERGEARDRARQRTLQQQAAMFAEAAGDRDGARIAYERIVASTRAELHLPAALRSHLAAQTNLATSVLGSEPAAAERRLRDALAVAEAHGFEDAGTLLPMRTYLGAALHNQRRLDDAHAVMEPTLADARTHYGRQDPWLGMVLSVAGNLAVSRGDYPRGDALLAESGEIAARSQGPDHPNARVVEADRALASVVAGDWPEALRRIDASLEDERRGESPRADILRAARAYVVARQSADPRHRSALLEQLGSDKRWSGRLRWLTEDWRAWALADPGPL